MFRAGIFDAVSAQPLRRAASCFRRLDAILLVKGDLYAISQHALHFGSLIVSSTKFKLTTSKMTGRRTDLL
jgi:hypothetical protein